MTFIGALSPDRVGDTLDAVNTELAERSLHEFVRRFWPVIEPVPFKDNWHIGVLCEHLEAVTRGEIQRIIFNIPPRCMKSILISCGWPAWTWIQRGGAPLEGPGVRFLYASYSYRLSVRDSVRTRRIIESPDYQKRYGKRFALQGDQNAKERFENDKHGYRIATSVGGSLTGDGADILVVDDPLNAKDAESEVVRQACNDWWDTSMSTRLNDEQTGAVVVIMQRLHEEDFTGHLLDKVNSEGEKDWEHLCLPMRYESDHPFVSLHDIRTEENSLLWPEHRPEDTVERQERDLGSYNTAGQLQQRPAPRKGGMFDSDWWGYVDVAPADTFKVRAWDLAATKDGGDWTVGLLLGYKDGIWYVEDVRRKQLSPHGVQQLVKATAEYDGRAVTILIAKEGGAMGENDSFTWSKLLVGWEVRFYREIVSKIERVLNVQARSVSAQAEAGNVNLVRAPWNKPFVDELALFPRGKHDDQVDPLTGAFNYLEQNIARRPRVSTVAPEVLLDGGDW